MKLNSLKRSVILSREHIDKIPLRTKIFDELVDMLYQHNYFAITTQLIASIGLVISLWHLSSHQLIMTWLIYMLVVYSFLYATTFYYHQQNTGFRQNSWLLLLASFIFFAGIGWGFAGSVLIPINNLINQTFIIILMVAITASSIAFFSPMIFIYALFLFPAFLPFDIWLFAQGDIYIFLGFFGLIYMLIMFTNCYYLNRFLVNTLKLRYKNMSRDITIRKQMKRQLAYQANHNFLTGLPNQTLLYDRIDYSIAYAKRYQTQLFLLFLDVDNFKLINDNLGHNVGDVLLHGYYATPVYKTKFRKT